MDDKKEKRKRRGERPNGLIQVSVQIGFRPDGKPDRKYFYGKTRAEANAKKEAFLKNLKNSKPSESGAFDPNMTLSDWIEIYKKTYRMNINPAYLAKDAFLYNRLSKALGHIRIADIREAHLQSVLTDVSGMSESTCKKYLQIIRRVFRRAKKNKIIADDPSEDLVMPPSVSGTHRALDDWEIDLILRNWNYPGVRGGIMILLMLLCGLRRGEAMALEWKSVDLDRREIRVEQCAVISKNQAKVEQRAKSDAGLRTIPVPETLLNALRSVPESSRNGFVCTNAHGGMLSESSYGRTMETFLNGVTRIANGEYPIQSGRTVNRRIDPLTTTPDPRVVLMFTAHDLRHTYATALYDAGVPVKAAQYFLGHSDIKITLNLYTHLSKERERESRNLAVNYLDSWVSKKLTAASVPGVSSD